MAEVFCWCACCIGHFEHDISYHLVCTLHVPRIIIADRFNARMYDLFVNGWGDITYYLSSSWLLAMDPIVAGLVAFMVQIFFAWRLHVIARQMWLTITIVVLSVITLGGALGVAISTLIVHEFVHFGEAKVKDVVYFWLVPTAVCDILICGALTYHLRRRKGTYKATGKLLDRIIRRECSMSYDRISSAAHDLQSPCRMVY